MRKLVYVAGLIFFSLHANAFEITFDKSIAYPGGIPQGWEKVGSGSIDILSPQPEEIGGEFGLRCSFFSAEGNNTLRTVSSIIPHDEIFCDNIAVECRVYLQPWQERVDYFQIVISTDGWNTSQEIGEPIALAVKGLDKSRWETVKRSKRIVGLRESGNAVSIGIKAIAAGSSERSGYVQYIKTQFVAVATPQDVQFEVNGEKVETVLPGESNACVSATLDVYPSSGEGAVTWTNVCCALDRNGVSTNLVMKWDDKLLRWKSAVPLPAIDAGEVLTASVYTEYVSTLGKFGTPTNVVIDGKICDAAREQSGEITVRGTKKGSVWINEFAPDKVELCGTTNRVMLSGWKLELATSSKAVASYYADLSGLFCFSNNMINGVVGLEIRELEWRDANGVPSAVAAFSPANSQTNYVVRLCNSAGIIEHDEVVALPLSGSVGKTKCTTWPQEGYGYDWEGTAESEIFDWTNFVASSFSEVNVGQGFKVPIEACLIVTTKTDTALLSYVTVVAKTRGLGNNLNPDATSSFTAQSFGGVATNRVKDVYSATPDRVPVELAASAFGWYSEPTNLVAQGSRKGLPVPETSAVLSLFPTIAMDDFSGTSLKAFWKNDSSCSLKWQVAQESGRGGVLQVATGWTDPGNAILNCSNFLQPDGHKCASISFDFKTYAYTSGLVDKFRVEVSTNSNWRGKVIRTKPLASKIEDRYTSAWHSYRFVFEMPTEFGEADEIWVRLVSASDGSTDFYTTLDNLRIAFEDVALPTNLTRTVETPVSGGSTGFVLDVLPQTTDEIEEVSADLHITVNGVKKIVPFAHPDGSLTNRISIVDGDGAPSQPCSTKLAISAEALEKALSTRFYAGDTVKYYAEIRNNSGTVEVDENGVCKTVYETRYFPDNATIDDEGRWIVEGEYKAIENQYGFTVDGPDIDILGAPVITADGIAFDYHAWDRTGNKGIVGLTATVRKEGEEVGTTSLFEGAATNRVTDTCALIGLAANTEYTLTITGKRNAGEDLASKSITFVTRPVLIAAKIVGTLTSTAKLTASGQAAGYVVTPSAWVQESDSVQGDVRTATWTRGEGTPNSPMAATVYATNKVGLASMTTNTVSGYTLAAVATKAPVIQKGTVTVEVSADEDYVAGDDGNPEGTEYAVRVTTSNGGDTLVTNGVGKAIWKTLKAWKDEPEMLAEPTIDLTATNFFSFVTRNFDEKETTNDKPVVSECDFPMTASFLGAGQVADPFGTVVITNVFTDPAQRAGAVAEVEYKIGEGKWTRVSGASIALAFDQIVLTNRLNWNAWTAVEQKEGEYAYQLRARVVSGSRSSEWAETSGTLDFVKPTVTVFESTTPDAFNVSPMTVTVTFSEPVVNFTSAAITVDGKGTAGEPKAVAGQDNTYTFDVMPTDQGMLTVQIKAGQIKDRFGNGNVAKGTLAKTFDVEAPKWDEPAITGTPANGSATNGTGYALAAHATDNLTGVFYYWSFDRQSWKTGEEFAGDVEEEEEKTYTVYVYATDAAGNVSTTNEWSWTYDKTSPVWKDPAITGVPANGSYTNEAHYALTAEAEDKLTAITYHWSFDEQIWTDGKTFENNVGAEGGYTAHVYATDEAGNVSTTNEWSWTYDKTPPEKPTISGMPENDAVVTETRYELKAESSDTLSPYTYRWSLKGRESTVATGSDAAFEGDITEDDVYQASVFAVDAAGNVSETNFWNWTVDRHAPTNLVVWGTPASNRVTNATEYNLFVSAEDLTDVTFNWTLDGKTWTTGTNFHDKVTVDGDYTARVYAEDEAKNVSVTNEWSWSVDTVNPKVTLTSAVRHPFNAAQSPWVLTAEFSEPVTNFTESCVAVDNGAATKVTRGEGNVYTIEVTPRNDGTVKVHIAAGATGDPAGNPNEKSVEWSRTYDTKEPTVELTCETLNPFNAKQKPWELTATFSEPVTNFTVESVWVENGTVHSVNAKEGEENAYTILVNPKEEGEVFVQIEAGVVADLAWNQNTASKKLMRIYDETAPTVELKSETLAPFNKAPWVLTATFSEPVTNFTDKSVSVVNGSATVSSVEGKANTYAITVTPTDTGTPVVEVVSVQIEAGVVADLAGNPNTASKTPSRTYDTERPTVTLSTETPGHFNYKAAPMVVTAKFSEPVTNFTAASIVVINGEIVDERVDEDKDQDNAYVFKVMPKPDVTEDEDYCDITVQINANVVADAAGNGNEAATDLVRKYDNRHPVVTLDTKTPDFFKDPDSFVVTATFVRGKESIPTTVTNFFADGVIAVHKGEVTEITPSFATNIYTFTIKPTDEGAITVQIPEAVVADAAGNLNSESDPLTRTYDVTPPTVPVLTGIPVSTNLEHLVATNGPSFDLTATAQDKTELKYHWTLNDKPWDQTVARYAVYAVPEGTNTVVVYATDAADNRGGSITNTWVVDMTPPTMPAVTGYPADGSFTNETPFRLTAYSEDATAVEYTWTLNKKTSEELGAVLAGDGVEGPNEVVVFATDEAGNKSVATNWTWTVDTKDPEKLNVTGLPISDIPSEINVTNGFDFAFTATAEDATALKFHWATNGVEVTDCTSSNFVGQVGEGTNTVSVYAEDAAGNTCKAIERKWVVDTIKPTLPVVVTCDPVSNSTVSVAAFTFEVWSEDATTITYHWALNGKDIDDVKGAALAGDGAEGPNEVFVYATDAAGNVSPTNSWTWTVDTKEPEKLNVTGLPISDNPEKVVVTNGFDFAFTATAEDATALKFHWATNGVEVTDCTSSNFVGQVGEGTNTVSVSAEDAAGNTCKAIERKWVVDTKGPSRPEIDGKPTDKSVTNNCEFDFTASASDDWSRKIDFHWSLKRGGDTASTKEGVGPTFKGEFNVDGTDDDSYTVSVWAIDEAGNLSETNSLSWTLDTIAPKMPVIVDASPASNSFVNVTNYNFKAAEPEGEEDATAVKFFWRIEGGDLDGKKEDPVTNFTGEVGMDGAYTAFVYAKDAAGNISPTNNLSWTVDTQIPTNLVISGWPANGSLTNGPNYCLTATADDATELTFHWTISDVAGVSDLSKDEPFEGKVADGTHTVSCYATDAAQNRSATKFWSWTSDTTGPTNLVLSVGTPSEGAVVATNGYDFTASAMDLTGIEYSWVLNGETSKNTTSNLVGTAAIEGTNTLSVTATDATGNPSEETLTRTWVVDTLSPTNLVVTGTPGDGALTNGTFFSWTAFAQDATRLTYHWSLLTNGVEVATEVVTNAFSDVGVEGTNTVTVYAKDEAGNVSATTGVTWTVDLTLPTVTLSTGPELPVDKVINLADVTPNGFKVTATFSEPVAGFTAASVAITNGNGEVTAVATNSASSYTVWILPAHDGLVPLQVADGAVKDLAGNDNVASDVLERTCDITPPKVTSITSNRNEPYGYLDELDGEPLKATLKNNYYTYPPKRSGTTFPCYNMAHGHWQET